MYHQQLNCFGVSWVGPCPCWLTVVSQPRMARIIHDLQVSRIVVSEKLEDLPLQLNMTVLRGDEPSFNVVPIFPPKGFCELGHFNEDGQFRVLVLPGQEEHVVSVIFRNSSLVIWENRIGSFL